MKGFFRNKWLNLAYIIICILIIVAYYCSVIFGWLKNEPKEKPIIKTELTAEDSLRAKIVFENTWDCNLNFNNDEDI